MRRFRFDRRTFLRGVGGASLALPLLEVMRPKVASAAPETPPRRYLVGFGGISVSGYSVNGQTADAVVPATEGVDYEMTRGLAPLGEIGVTQHVSVISGMKIPWDEGSGIPKAGRARRFHNSSLGPLFSGMRTGPGGNPAPKAPTSDQIVADAIGGDTLHQSIQTRVQAALYRSGVAFSSGRGLMSFRESGGSLVPLEPISNPQLLFQALFSGFTPDDPQAAALADYVRRRRLSIIDLVQEDAAALVSQLGTADQHRLERHMDEIRDLETRLSQVDTPIEQACILPENPGSDWPIGTEVPLGNNKACYASGGGYSNEDERARVITDLIGMAFACDLTRVTSLMYTMAQCLLSAKQLFDHNSEFHEISHGALGKGQKGVDAMADSFSWHVKHFGLLVQKLASYTDIDGSSVLDNTSMVLLFEGGVGYDPEGNKNSSPHSTENMVALIAGHAGGLNSGGGKHIATKGLVNPAQVVKTAMSAVGVDAPLGEVTDNMPGLL